MAINFLPESTSRTAFNEYETNSPVVRNTGISSILPTVLTEINSKRQGIQLRTSSDLYTNGQMKIWTGKILPNGLIEQGVIEEELISIGQTPSFSRMTGITAFKEQEEKFNPEKYVRSPETYPYPIQLNGGLPMQAANVIEVFPLPFRFNSIESKYLARGIKGFLSCGPQEGLTNGNQVVSQFIYENHDVEINEVKPFLDSGQITMGGIQIPGYKLYKFTSLPAFVERENNYDKELLNSDSTFDQAIKTLDYSRDNDIRQTFNKKSCSAGSVVGNTTYNISGTDSISYRGRIRGS